MSTGALGPGWVGTLGGTRAVTIKMTIFKFGHALWRSRGGGPGPPGAPGLPVGLFGLGSCPVPLALAVPVPATTEHYCPHFANSIPHVSLGVLAEFPPRESAWKATSSGMTTVARFCGLRWMLVNATESSLIDHGAPSPWSSYRLAAPPEQPQGPV